MFTVPLFRDDSGHWNGGHWNGGHWNGGHCDFLWMNGDPQEDKSKSSDREESLAIHRRPGRPDWACWKNAM